jgi:hypothetical protein
MKGRFFKLALPLACASILAVSPAVLAAKRTHAGAPATAAGQARIVIGNTVHRVEDDGEYYDYYAPNGAATSLLVSNKDVTHGRWTVQGGNLCINYPDDTPACYRVEVSGGLTTLTEVSSGTLFPVQIIHGNPRGL